jgi:hypothetical protein
MDTIAHLPRQAPLVPAGTRKLFTAEEFTAMGAAMGAAGIIHIHTAPSEAGYRNLVEIRYDALATPCAASGLVVRLVDLNLGWEPEA